MVNGGSDPSANDELNNPTRTTTKESYLNEVDLNLNNCNRPSKIANSQTYLITPKRLATVVNRRPENQDISKVRKLQLEDKRTVNRSEKQVII